MSLGTTCPDRGMVRVKETIGGQNLLGATAAPDCPLQYCVSMLSDATQRGRVLECELTVTIGFVTKKYQLPASPPTVLCRDPWRSPGLHSKQFCPPGTKTFTS